jgi:O-antigen ligase
MSRTRQLRHTLPPALRTGDAVTLLTLFVLLVFAIPSRLVFAPLGGAGSPAQLLGIGALLWWTGHRLARAQSLPKARQPIRRATLLFVAAALASYVAATIRPIDDVELRAADRGVLILCAWLGVVLIAADGIPSRDRLDTLLRRVAIAGGAVAALGLLQFWTGMAFTNLIQIPGLSESAELNSVAGRDGFVRPAGTSLHPIEFGVVLTMVLPLAIHFALYDRERPMILRSFPVLAIGLAIPISISRSAIVCTIVVLAFLLPTWPRSLRRRAYAALAALAILIFVGVPGMLGSLIGLFSGITNDSSALSRTDSYALAWDYIARAPVFGRGFQTFLPVYRILDNQYLLTAIEMGIVGLAALLGLFISGILTGRRIRKLSTNLATQRLAQALVASVAAGAFGFALFDALSFPQLASLVFLVLGAIAALYRLDTIGDSVYGEPDFKEEGTDPLVSAHVKAAPGTVP